MISGILQTPIAEKIDYNNGIKVSLRFQRTATSEIFGGAEEMLDYKDVALFIGGDSSQDVVSALRKLADRIENAHS